MSRFPERKILRERRKQARWDNYNKFADGKQPAWKARPGSIAKAGPLNNPKKRAPGSFESNSK